jgi:hypothetical protein
MPAVDPYPPTSAIRSFARFIRVKAEQTANPDRVVASPSVTRVLSRRTNGGQLFRVAFGIFISVFAVLIVEETSAETEVNRGHHTHSGWRTQEVDG